MREISCINLDMTTRCDRRCPDCCAGIGINRTLEDHPWEYFERFARFAYGIDRVNLVGGEPTFHRSFAEFVPKFRQLFGCRLLTLQTDGWGVERYAHLMPLFDHIYMSRYDERNAPAADFVQINFPSTEWSGEFTPRSRRGSGKPCERGFSETVAYADGVFHGCCVSPGIPDASTLEPCDDWRPRVVELPLPCSECWFSPNE